MIKKYYLSELTETSVNLKIEHILEFEGDSIVVKTEVGAYANNNYDREQLSQKLEGSQILSAIFAMWGDEASLPDLPREEAQSLAE